MKKYLIRLADHLDKKGLYKEANYLDKIIKLSEQEFEVSFETPMVFDGSKPLRVSEDLFELSWGVVYDITLSDDNKVTSLKVELANGNVARYTTSFKNGVPLANTIKDLNAKYNLNLTSELNPSKPLIKDDEEVLRMFADAIQRSEDMSYDQMEEEFNYFYKNYGHLDPKFLSMIRNHKKDQYVASEKEKEFRKAQEYKKSEEFKIDATKAIKELYKAVTMANDGDVESAKARLNDIISYFPHHTEEIKDTLAVLKQTPGLMALRSIAEGAPVFTSIETEEFAPVGPGMKPSLPIPEKYMP